MTTTDLKPGDLVQHPKHPELIGTVSYDYPGVLWVNYVGSNGYRLADHDLTDWERVEVVQPGHVQIKVDDLELHGWANTSPSDRWNDEEILSHRAAKAIAAQRAESTPPADEPEIVGDGCECWVTPEHMWTTYYGAVEPGSQVEYNSRCPKHGEKPTSATVTLPCPDCGEALPKREARVARGPFDGKWVAFEPDSEVHTCKLDEPTEFGARVTVTLPDGTREKWLRSKVGTNEAWRAENGSEIGWFIATTWDNVIERGTVTLGWDE